MTHAAPDRSLSRLELVVLARLSCANPPSEKALAEAVSDLVMSGEPPGQAHEAVIHTLTALRRRSLVSDRKRAATDEGNHALRAAFDLPRTPTWPEVRNAHLAARALGLAPGSEQAAKILKDASTIALAVLRAQFKLPDHASLAAICDVLIAEALGLPPGPVTIGRIRAHVLAQQIGGATRGTPRQMAVQLAAKTLKVSAPDKRTMGRALGRRWLYEAVPSSDDRTAATPRAVPAQPALPLSPAPAAAPKPPTAAAHVPAHLPAQPPAPGFTRPTQPALALSADTLLTLVRDAIPRVGADGRFGAEKVFVSALWHRIERDGGLPDLSFERFKRWLVTANRDQLLDLARADLVGAMDPKLVAESEIEHLGTTFHFVVDRRATSGRELHAR